MDIIKILILIVHLAHGSEGSFHASNCESNRRALVHLFEWKWNDVAAECERFLGPHGFCGVQISPPSENAVIGVDEGSTEPPRPWWERYQPISYKLETRSGSHDQFVDMVRRCNNANVRIYADGVVNHMAGMGRSGAGTGGTEFDSDLGDFPGVPYTMENFNDCEGCPDCCCINDWTATDQVRNCRLSGLIDLNQALPDTHDKIVAFMNDLIDIGVAGFRIDAGKHMFPDDLEAIFNDLKDLNTEWFDAGSKPFVYLEVLDYNQNGEVSVHEYTHIGRVTEFRFCSKVGDAAEHLSQIPFIYDPGWGMCEPENAFTFVDNHDNQRGHGGGDASITFKDPYMYNIAQTISLAHDYGWPRVMSSYDFGDDTERGPPYEGDYNTADVVIGADGQCEGDWVCEHRWAAIAGMAGFSKATNGMTFDNWVNEGNKGAWSRGGKGFVAITKEGDWTSTFQTGMPAGDYCNIIEGCATSSGCVGGTITVGGDGTASVTVPGSDVPIVAIHVEAPAGSNQCVDGGGSPDGTTTAPGATGAPTTTTSPGATTTTSETTTASETTTTTTASNTATTPDAGSTTTTEAGPGDWQTTIVYLAHETNPGEDLFIRGGISHSMRQECTEDVTTDPCSIPITHATQSGSHFDKYSAWSEGDEYLDWYGPEPSQGDYEGQTSGGTPLFWTTNDESDPGYQPDNVWGPHYWKVEFDMDCSRTEDGWFELKGYGNQAGWESDVDQGACDGTVGGTPPYATTNHMARCGYRNIFQGYSSECTIDEI